MEAIDDYLETCERLGKKPEMQCKGSLNVRLGPELHNCARIKAKEKNISRQAVLDAIDKACQKLDEYEVALKFGARNEKISRRLNDLLHEDNLDDVKKKIEEIIKEI